MLFCFFSHIYSQVNSKFAEKTACHFIFTVLEYLKNRWMLIKSNIQIWNMFFCQRKLQVNWPNANKKVLKNVHSLSTLRSRQNARIRAFDDTRGDNINNKHGEQTLLCVRMTSGAHKISLASEVFGTGYFQSPWYLHKSECPVIFLSI